ncbi:MAG: tetratricopeptide repeat protein [Pseudomonadota bacterium]
MSHQANERLFKRKAFEIKITAVGYRNKYTEIELNNLATMEANDGNFVEAVNYASRAVAVALSLDNPNHPNTFTTVKMLINIHFGNGCTHKAKRLANGDFSDLTPIVEEIEEEHRQWVAQDSDNRKFGPPSPITGATE